MKKVILAAVAAMTMISANAGECLNDLQALQTKYDVTLAMSDMELISSISGLKAEAIKKLTDEKIAEQFKKGIERHEKSMLPFFKKVEKNCGAGQTTYLFTEPNDKLNTKIKKVNQVLHKKLINRVQIDIDTFVQSRY